MNIRAVGSFSSAASDRIQCPLQRRPNHRRRLVPRAGDSPEAIRVRPLEVAAIDSCCCRSPQSDPVSDPHRTNFKVLATPTAGELGSQFTAKPLSQADTFHIMR